MACPIFRSPPSSPIMDQPAQSQPRILPSGDAALVVEFGRTIDDAVNARVLALDDAVAGANIPGVLETVPTYRSLLVHYDPLAVDFATLSGRLVALASEPGAARDHARHWRVPVAYGGEYGADLDDVARTLGRSVDDVVRLHTAPVYRVAMIGFTPGWSYLSGMDPALAISRRQSPRVTTPAGTISIGGVQAGIQCIAGPSGWHLLGCTPVRTYHPHRNPMFLLEPGDSVTFFSIDPKDYPAMVRAAEAGEPIAEDIREQARS